MRLIHNGSAKGTRAELVVMIIQSVMIETEDGKLMHKWLTRLKKYEFILIVLSSMYSKAHGADTVLVTVRPA